MSRCASGVEQRLGLVLSVQVHQQGAELRQDRGRRRAAVHPRARAAFGRDLAAHHHSPVLHIEAEGLDPQPGRRVEALERAFDDGLACPGTDLPAGRALAQQQRQRVHQHRLPGTGLAGEHVEAGAEVEGDIGDGGEVADAELGEHGGS